MEHLEPRLLLSSAHPFLLTTAGDFPRLQALAEQSPWSDMIAGARATVTGLWPDEQLSTVPPIGTLYESQQYWTVADILSASSLLYIIDHDDPALRQEHLNRIVDGISVHLPFLRIDNGENAGVSLGGSVLFNAVLAMDVIYDDSALSADTKANLEQKVGNRVDQIAFSGPWPYARYSVHGIWNIFLESIDSNDPNAGVDYLQQYYTSVVEDLTGDGVFTSSAQYALMRLGNQHKASKSLYMDVLEFTGRTNADYRFYDNPLFQNFYAWLYSNAITPNGSVAVIGDSAFQSVELPMSSPAALRAGLFGPQAEAAAAYAATVPGTDGQHYDPSGLVTTYLLSAHPSLVGQTVGADAHDLYDAAPALPQSRIYPDGGAWFYGSSQAGDVAAFRDALTGTLWNPKNQAEHSQTQTNALLVNAFGQSMLLNAGFNGAGKDFIKTWDWIHDTAISANTLAFEYQGSSGLPNNHWLDPLHPNEHQRRMKHGDGIVEGFTTDLFDYATGDSGPAVVDANGQVVDHQRTLAFVHPDPEAGTEGYFLLDDEVDALGGSQPFHVYLHPNTRKGLSTGEVNIVTDQFNTQYTAPISGWNVDWYYTEDFSDNRAEEFEPVAGSWTTANSIYSVHAATDQRTISLLPTERLKLPANQLPDVYQVDVRLQTLNTTGKLNAFVLFDYQDENNYKFAGVDTANGSKWVIGRYVNGQKQTLVSTGYAPTSNWISMEVVIDNITKTVRVYNRPSGIYWAGGEFDEKLGTLSASYTFSSQSDLNDGSLGLGTIGADTNFDRLFVRRPASLKPDLTIFYGTAPQSVTNKSGVFAETIKDDGEFGFRTEFLDAQHLTNADGDAHVLTALFPHNAQYPLANMQRLVGDGYTGIAVNHDGTVSDYALAMEPNRQTDTLTFGDVSMSGISSVFRRNNGATSFYFLRQGTQWSDGNLLPQGFESQGGPLTVYMRDTAGKVTADVDTLVTFYHPDLAGVKVDGVIQNFTFASDGAQTILVPEGTHEVELLITGAALPTITVSAVRTATPEISDPRLPGIFRISRDNPRGELEVFYSLSGTATEIIDYISSRAGPSGVDSGHISFADGEAYKDILIFAQPDTLYEADPETAVLALSGHAGYQVAAANNSATVTIGPIFPLYESFDLANQPAEGFQPQLGNWQVTSAGEYRGEAAAGQSAISTLPLLNSLPATYQIDVQLRAVNSGVAGMGSNAYVLFDHALDTAGARTFKFAGLDITNQRWVIGHYEDGTWLVDRNLTATLTADTAYQLRLIVADNTVRLSRFKPSVSAYVQVLTHDFREPLQQVRRYRPSNLSDGQIGLGANNAWATFDKLSLGQPDLSAAATLPDAHDFATAAPFFSPQAGTWSISRGRYRVTTAAGYSTSLLSLADPLPANFDISTLLRVRTTAANRNAFIIFDYKSPTDFKYAAAWVNSDQWVIGRVAATDSPVPQRINYSSVTDSLIEDQDYSAMVRIEGSRATLWVTRNGVPVESGSVDFRDPLNRGQVGLGTYYANAQFDDFAVQARSDSSPVTTVENFSDAAQDMNVAAGYWQVREGRYMTGPSTLGDNLLLSLFRSRPGQTITHLDTQMTMDFGRTGMSNQAFLVFDYVSNSDFKFAGGISVPDAAGSYRWVIGDYDGQNWNIIAQWSAEQNQMLFDQPYELTLDLEYDRATLAVNGIERVTQTFDEDITNGAAGLGALKAFVQFDNLTATWALHNDIPIIGSLTANPNLVKRGDPFSLLAAQVTDSDGSVDRVDFYRDSNQSGALEEETDEYLGQGVSGGSGWTWTGNGSTWSLGVNRFFARAQDQLGARSKAATATATVYDLLPYVRTFNAGEMDFFVPVVGSWSIDTNARYVANADSGEFAISRLDLPIAPLVGGFQVDALVRGVTGGTFKNGFVVFDYQSPSDFKYAGLFFGDSTVKIGRYAGSTFLTHATFAAGVAVNIDYNLSVVVQGGQARLSLNGKEKLAYIFGGDLNDGKVGLGTRKAVAHFDNFVLQALPTLPYAENFNDNNADFFTAILGSWSIDAGGRYLANAVSSSNNAISLVNLADPLPSNLAINAVVRGKQAAGFNRNGFIIFDYQDANNFKYAGAWVWSNRWRIGHVTNGTWFTDATSTQTLAAATDYSLRVELLGNAATLKVNGVTNTSFTFADALNDGRVGLGTKGAVTIFDDFLVQVI